MCFICIVLKFTSQDISVLNSTLNDLFIIQVGLEVVFILTMTALHIGINQTLPPVSYFKAIDIWCFACLLMICLALMECILVSYLSKPSSRPTQPVPKDSAELQPLQGSNCEEKPREVQCCTGARKQNLAAKINNASRVIFPVSFILFNIIFWALFLSPVQ